METNQNFEHQQGKDGAYIVPLDQLRTIAFATKIFISGEYPGSAAFPIASGKVAYLKQAIITNLSGIFPIHLKWADAATAQSGNQISGSAFAVDLIINSGQVNNGTYIAEFIPGLGPYQSGIVMVSGGSQMGGTATAIMQIDPQTYE